MPKPCARVVDEVIGTGGGSNFVIKRSFVADISDYGPHSALAFFRRLLENESGAHWTFVIHTGSRTFVGASPERHISLEAGTAVMNPISGTYRYPPTGPTLTGVMDFLADAKETDELCMVVDEELKMMARICASGARVAGPYLKEMARLAHTEYFIEGRTTARRTEHPARDPVRADGDGQPAGERMPRHRTARAAGAAATTAVWPRSSAGTNTAAAPWTRPS